MLGWEKACSVYGMHQEDIDNFLAFQAGPAFSPSSRRESLAARRGRRRGLHKGIDLSFFDIEPKGREHTADGGEF